MNLTRLTFCPISFQEKAEAGLCRDFASTDSLQTLCKERA